MFGVYHWAGVGSAATISSLLIASGEILSLVKARPSQDQLDAPVTAIRFESGRETPLTGFSLQLMTEIHCEQSGGLW